MPAYIDRVIVQVFVRDTDAKGRDVLVKTDQGELVHEVPQQPTVIPTRGHSAPSEVARYLRGFEKRLKDS